MAPVSVKATTPLPHTLTFYTSAKFYQLTRKGRAHLESETAGWQRLADAVGHILRAAEGEAL